VTDVAIMTKDFDDDATKTTGHGRPVAVPEALITILRWVRPLNGSVTAITDAPAVVGRDPACATRIDAGEVSRRHAEVQLVAGTARVRDLESKNGVFVNGKRQGDAVLHPGDVVRLGDAVAVVETVNPDELEGAKLLGPALFGGAALKRVVKRARQAAKSTLNIVLQGETGTGKERFARAVHEWSGRIGSFVAVNAAGYQESTAAAELFGYRKGAFTGAARASIGHVRAAHGGTLFLDEILELPFELQAKLLRAIEQKEVLPLGETEAQPVDLRFITASQGTLAEAVARGRFRADLKARLEGLVLDLPPLRERKPDIVPLFLRFLSENGSGRTFTLTADLAEALCLYDWPLNVRELETLARRLVTLHPEVTDLELRHADEWLGEGPLCTTDAVTAAGKGARRATSAYDAEELSALRAALERHGGNLTKATAELGITRPKAYRMLRSRGSDE
jgi:sigma-54 dependent transcriptional regulator, acetoin dehydrogenase operon transcriptional activator AcoR